MKKIKIFQYVFLIMSVGIMATGLSGAYFTSHINTGILSLETGNWATPTPEETPGKVIISEVFYNPDGTDTGQEWIELYNAGGSSIDLAGYDLFAAGFGHFVFPEFNLEKEKLVVVHTNTDGANSATDLYTGSGRTNINNSSGSIAVFSTSSPLNGATIIDFVQYGAGGRSFQTAAVGAGIWQSGAYVPTTTEGNSLELIDKADHNLIGDWRDQKSPNPGV